MAFNKRLQKEYSYENRIRSNRAFTRSSAKESLKELNIKIKENKKREREKEKTQRVFKKIDDLKNNNL